MKVGILLLLGAKQQKPRSYDFVFRVLIEFTGHLAGLDPITIHHPQWESMAALCM